MACTLPHQPGDDDGRLSLGDVMSPLMRVGNCGCRSSTNLIPNYATHLRGASRTSRTTRSTACPTASRTAAAPNLLMWRHRRRDPGRRRRWAQMSRSRRRRLGKVSVYDAPIYIADAAVVPDDDASPTLGIKNPYAARRRPVRRPRSTCCKQQKPAITQYWVDYLEQMDDFTRRATSTSGRPGRSSAEPAAGRDHSRPGRRHQADRRARRAGPTPG